MSSPPSHFQSSFSNLKSEFAVGSIFGLRGYFPRLGILSGKFEVWNTKEMTASCHKKCEIVPNPHCSCGIYAYWEDGKIPDNEITAVVEAWGHILIGENGFRAQHARIAALAHPLFEHCELDTLLTEKEEWVSVNSETVHHAMTIVEYNVPFFNSTELMLKEFPVSQEYAT